MGYGGDKTNKVSIDGEYVGTFVTKAEEYNDAVLSKVILTAGKHEVSITKSWGWIAVDYLKIQPAEAIPEYSSISENFAALAEYTCLSR